jgi:hypothetical protein
LLHALGHRDLAEREIGARIIDFRVADFAVHFQHAVLILKHIPGDRARERVLHIRIDIHFHHAVIALASSLIVIGPSVLRSGRQSYSSLARRRVHFRREILWRHQ